MLGNIARETGLEGNVILADAQLGLNEGDSVILKILSSALFQRMVDARPKCLRTRFSKHVHRGEYRARTSKVDSGWNASSLKLGVSSRVR